MTDFNAARYATLAVPYFDHDITDETTMHEYIEDAHIPDMPDWTLEDNLTQAIGDDMHDLLKNGNDEELNWSEADVEALRQLDYYDRLDEIARLTAKAILTRIYPTEGSEPTA